MNEHSSSFAQTIENLSEAVHAVDPERACLFGSAVELGSEANDFDVLVISNSFEDVLFYERQDLILFPDQKPVDLWPYTVEEFSSLYSSRNPVRKSIEHNHIRLV